MTETLDKQTAVSIGLMVVIIGAAVWTAVGMHDIPDIKVGLKDLTVAVNRLTVQMELAPTRTDIEELRLRVGILEDKVKQK